MSKQLSNEEFINKCKQIHGDTYDYSYINYQGMRNPITVKCKEHGYWRPLASNFVNGRGCPICGQRKNSRGKNFTKESFIEKAREIHGDKYDYSKVKYINSTTPVKIICPIHGEFQQSAHAHLHSKSECPKCANINRGLTQKISGSKSFIEKAKRIHDNKYDYSKVNYIDSKTPVIIICPIHGEFQQIPNVHLIGKGCAKCAGNYQRKSKEEIINDCKKIHGDKYDYSEFNVLDTLTPSIIICPIHGKFKQSLHAHIHSKAGCPMCVKTISNQEIEIKQYMTEIIDDDIILNSRNILPSNLELDIYVPSKKIAIEFNGLFWHNDILKDRNYHLQKTIECEKLGIKLIHIFEDEWLEKQSIVESRLRQIFGKQKFKIPARKCIIKQVPVKDERLFLENNHLQGYIASQICYGLYFTNPDNNKEYLVSLMSFGKLRKNLGSKAEDNIFEMYRFCNLKNFNIQGGASKLFKHFIKQFKPKQVISFADRRWSSNNEHTLYNRLGFEFQCYTEPSYFYVNGQQRINRFTLRKDILVSKYGCPKEMSEYDFVTNILGYQRIYDCGNLKYVWLSKQS